MAKAQKTILVTGGAGYIGSAAVKALIEKGHNVIVADNLSKGLKRLVDKKAKFYKADLTDYGALEKIFKSNKNIDTIMHFAAYKAVEESMEKPEKYSDNIIGTINLLGLMIKYKVKKIIYSSTAAIYGEPEHNPMDESHPAKPVNYYGFTKLESEKIIEWHSRIHGINYTILRYFNVAGDAGLGYTDPEAKNVMPILMEVIFGKRKKFMVFGNDYPTRDGTCIRDYVDINDLIKAHILAMDAKENAIINLGTSNGVSVKELVDATFEVTGKKFLVEYAGRRKGDPAELFASNENAKKLLGWIPEKSIKDMIKSTYEAYKKNMTK
ncbi:UDP-glucose 4-epimerase GalE [Candidatus Woesearchaeota archaeon]|nr:UDP-glucose 4-epimerase GalE [Candidatus Woesearchaeota archaeon]